ncbi:MAG: Ig-like domain-containing protein, partial [Rhodospirillaceae bacterium]
MAGLLSCKGDSPTEAPGPISLTLSPSSVALAGPGDTVSVVASVTEVGGGAVSSASLTWTSDNKAVAEVSSTGRVTAIASGTAGITVEALSNGRTATQTLTVTVGSAVLAGAGGGAVSLAAGVDLVIPAGALPGQVFMTAKAATGLPTQPAAIPGTAFEFGPDGVVFSAPV